MLPDRVVGLFGYGVCDARSLPDASRYVAVVLPYWLITLPTSVPLLLIAWRHWHDRGARRIAMGRCAACGYDLRESPGRCPECGAVSVATPPLPPTALA